MLESKLLAIIPSTIISPNVCKFHHNYLLKISKDDPRVKWSNHWEFEHPHLAVSWFFLIKSQWFESHKVYSNLLNWWQFQRCIKIEMSVFDKVHQDTFEQDAKAQILWSKKCMIKTEFDLQRFHLKLYQNLLIELLFRASK